MLLFQKIKKQIHPPTKKKKDINRFDQSATILHRGGKNYGWGAFPGLFPSCHFHCHQPHFYSISLLSHPFSRKRVMVSAFFVVLSLRLVQGKAVCCASNLVKNPRWLWLVYVYMTSITNNLKQGLEHNNYNRIKWVSRKVRIALLEQHCFLVLRKSQHLKRTFNRITFISEKDSVDFHLFSLSSLTIVWQLSEAQRSEVPSCHGVGERLEIRMKKDTLFYSPSFFVAQQRIEVLPFLWMLLYHWPMRGTSAQAANILLMFEKKLEN